MIRMSSRSTRGGRGIFEQQEDNGGPLELLPRDCEYGLRKLPRVGKIKAGVSQTMKETDLWLI
jgi:hypothetical protein